MQNKPNLLDAQMNLSLCFTMNYELQTMNYFMQNKPNQTQPVLSLPNGSNPEHPLLPKIPSVVIHGRLIIITGPMNVWQGLENRLKIMGF